MSMPQLNLELTVEQEFQIRMASDFIDVASIEDLRAMLKQSITLNAAKDNVIRSIIKERMGF